jgi:hypothetical protein
MFTVIIACNYRTWRHFPEDHNIFCELRFRFVSLPTLISLNRLMKIIDYFELLEKAPGSGYVGI